MNAKTTVGIPGGAYRLSEFGDRCWFAGGLTWSEKIQPPKNGRLSRVTFVGQIWRITHFPEFVPPIGLCDAVERDIGTRAGLLGRDRMRRLNLM